MSTSDFYRTPILSAPASFGPPALVLAILARDVLFDDVILGIGEFLGAGLCLFRASVKLLSPALRQLNHLFTSHVGPMCVMRENGNTEEGFWHFGCSYNGS